MLEFESILLAIHYADLGVLAINTPQTNYRTFPALTYYFDQVADSPNNFCYINY